MLNKINDAANLIKAKIARDPLEILLIEATSEENWRTSSQILYDIADSSYNYEKYNQISGFIWEKLQKKTSWRKIYKTLDLIDFLLKNGSPSAKSSFKLDLHHIKSLENYQYMINGEDKGFEIREKSKKLVEILTNDDLYEAQRQRASDLRKRMIATSSQYMSFNKKNNTPATNYQAFNHKNYEKFPDHKTSQTYKYESSTLQKYKGNVQQKNKDKTQENTNKKAFEKIAPNLKKPETSKQVSKEENLIDNIQEEKQSTKTHTESNLLHNLEFLSFPTTVPEVPKIQLVPNNERVKEEQIKIEEKENKKQTEFSKVKWLSKDEKKLIDFSDFGNEMKNSEVPSGSLVW